MSMTERDQAVRAMKAALKELREHSNCLYASDSDAEIALKQAIRALEI